jgi:hypothetical protein
MQNFPFSKTLFWDIDENNIDLTAKKEFIIPRVFVRGGMKDVKLLMSMYNQEEIIEALKKSRELDKMTHNFCINYFHISKEEMHAPSEFYQ